MLRKFYSFQIALLVSVSLLSSSAPAQDPFGGGIDPFGGTGGASPLDAGDTSTTKAAKPKDDGETDLVVLAIRKSNPTTPDQLGHAILNLVNLGRPDEVKKYIAQLLGGSPDEGTLVELHRTLGSAIFMRMSRDSRFAPEGSTLAKAVLDAAHAASHDPAHLAGLIDKLSDPDPAIRHTALVDLRSGGTDAVIALIGVLADSSRSAEHLAVRATLVNLKEVSVGPLVGALETRDEALLPQVIVVLSRLNVSQVTPHLLRPYFTSDPNALVRRAAEYGLTKLLGELPTRADGEHYLARETQAYLDGKLLGRLDYENMITFWSWDATKSVPIERRYPGATASLMMAARLASDLYAISPNNIDHQRLYLTALLESSKRANGLANPLPTGAGTAHAAAAALGVDAIVDVLEYALAHEKTAAATGAIEVLREIGDQELLRSSSGRPSSLALCLKHADRRVRFAAVETIMKLDPVEPFAGSSYLSEALGYFASTVGSRRVLVAHPRTDQAQTLVGMLNDLGFEADTAQTGRQTLRLSVQYPDYEFFLISDAIDYPAAGELIQQLRRDPRTTALPIGLMARQEQFEAMARLTEFDPLGETFPRPHDVSSVSLASRRLLDRAGDDLVTFDERMAQAVASLGHLARLAEQSEKYSFYNLLRLEPIVQQALNTSQLTDQAARVLGSFGTPSAQRSLVVFASQNARRLSERQAAATAFDAAISKRGLLLARNEIQVQYDRYNQSKILDSETQAVLGSLLDSIERPTRQPSAQGDASTAEAE
jgi:CheY-like chemotaxis protein